MGYVYLSSSILLGTPERMGVFETTYKKRIVPILKKYDLEESYKRGRRTVEGVFSRLFEVETPSAWPGRTAR